MPSRFYKTYLRERRDSLNRLKKRYGKAENERVKRYKGIPVKFFI